ncbi:MAG: hypothetical protein IPM64_12050 [Phycisphaerales bacterium]|nr:hypothetical protein [Phycisphaerales bacterium]
MNDSSPTPPAALDGRSLAIGVLSITACIFLVGLVLLIQTPPALGIGQLDRGGDYIMLTQQISSSSEGLVIVDGGSNRMVLYTFDFNQKKLAQADGFELSKLRQNSEEERPRGRRR